MDKRAPRNCAGAGCTSDEVSRPICAVNVVPSFRITAKPRPDPENGPQHANVLQSISITVHAVLLHVPPPCLHQMRVFAVFDTVVGSRGRCIEG